MFKPFSFAVSALRRIGVLLFVPNIEQVFPGVTEAERFAGIDEAYAHARVNRTVLQQLNAKRAQPHNSNRASALYAQDHLTHGQGGAEFTADGPQVFWGPSGLRWADVWRNNPHLGVAA